MNSTITKLVKKGFVVSSYSGYLTILSNDGSMVSVNNRYHLKGWSLENNYNRQLADYYKLKSIGLSSLRGAGMNNTMRLGFVPVSFPWCAIPLMSAFIVSLSKVPDSLAIIYNGVMFSFDGTSGGHLPNFDKQEYLNLVKLYGTPSNNHDQ